MAKANSTSTRGKSQRKDFPLHKHARGYWCRKINGKKYYFGKVADDPDGVAALRRHDAEYEDLKAGRPVAGREVKGPTLHDLCNTFLNAKLAEQEAGIISRRWYDDLYSVCELMLGAFGRLRSLDSIAVGDLEKLRLKIIKDHSPMVARNLIARVRSVFAYAVDSELVAKNPARSKLFRGPNKQAVRRHRAQRGPQLWSAEQVWAMLDKANATMRLMIFLGINAGFNNSDLASVPVKALDLKTAWLDFPRAKTGIRRRVPLWPETIDAAKAYLAERTNHGGNLADLLFVTRWGNRWQSWTIVQEFNKLLAEAEILEGSFIWFRKTVQTIGEKTGDLIAVKGIMGHVDDSISDHYRQEIADERLLRVANTVRDWLLAAKPKKRKYKKGS